MVQLISLDIAGTLIDFYYFDYVWNTVIPQLYAQKQGLDFDVAEHYVLREYARIGNKDVRWYLPEYWFDYLRLREDPIEIFTAHQDKIRFYPDALSVIPTFGLKWQLIIASGVPRSIQGIILQQWKPYFKHVFSSVSDLREAKKTTKFYDMICTVLEIEPGRLTHVGDDYHHDYIIPRQIGIQSFLLDRTGRKKGRYIIKDLRELEAHLEN